MTTTSNSPAPVGDPASFDLLAGTESVPRTVRRVGFGAMQLAGPGVFGPPADPAEAVRILRRAVELGVNHIDTSDFYGPWVVNELIARALRPYRDDLVIATKVGAYRDQHGGWLPLGHPDALKAQVHDNLRRLGVDALDLVYLRFLVEQPGYDFADQVGALGELREAGLVRHIGLSQVSPAQFDLARGIVPITAVQNEFNLVNRVHGPMVRRTAEEGVAFVPYFPLGSGFRDSRARADRTLADVADGLGRTQAQVSLAWLLRYSPNVLLIPGTSSGAHLEENVAAGQVRLNGQDIARLDALVADGESLEGSH